MWVVGVEGGGGSVLGFLLGNQDVARREALSFESVIHVGYLGLGLGPLRVGTVVLRTPQYQVLTLGAKGYLPSRYIVSLLWVLKQFAWQIPTRQIVGSFKKYPPKYPVGTL